MVLVIEDIHWADPSTLDFLSFVARNARGERMLLIATHRLHDGRDLQALERYVDQLERCPAVEPIALGPLTEAQVSEQIEAILRRPADTTTTRRITARTQGNPFYVEELIAHGATAEAPLPAGQAATLLERIGTLSPETQHVLHVLAAFGRAIEHDLLASRRRDRGARAVAAAAHRRRRARDRGDRLHADVPPRSHARSGLRGAAPGRAAAPARRRGQGAVRAPGHDRRRRAGRAVARCRGTRRGARGVDRGRPRRGRRLRLQRSRRALQRGGRPLELRRRDRPGPRRDPARRRRRGLPGRRRRPADRVVRARPRSARRGPGSAPRGHVLRAARPLPGPSSGQVAVVLQRGAPVPRRRPERRARPPARRREPHAHAQRALG